MSLTCRPSFKNRTVLNPYGHSYIHGLQRIKYFHFPDWETNAKSDQD